ncbi:hypothetical protein GLOIN_2v811958 [Rhizophagus irregularis DAOM 181602=DAOM 197198]|nr:hypothetical protein GLOIN_2v811958 [Rhizophagus irregularis DAOM 181602=DAOM 197198]
MPITLLYFIKENMTTSTFAIDINREKLVSYFKNAIKAKKQNDFAGIDADRLKLWKIIIFDDRDDLLSNLTLQDKLFATKDIEEY